MSKKRALTRLMVISAILPIILILVLTAVAYYLVNQQLTAQKISHYSWQFDQIKDGSVRFKHIDFIFNQQFNVHLENIEFSFNDSTTQNNSLAFFSFKNINIAQVKVSLIKPKNNQTNLTTETTIKQIMNNVNKTLEAIQNKPAWLAFLPQKIRINSFNLKTPCLHKSCSIGGTTELNITQSNTAIKALGQLKLYDKAFKTLQIQNQFSLNIPLNIDLNAPSSITKHGLKYTLDSELKDIKRNTNLIHFLQKARITEKQSLSVFTQFSGFLPGKDKMVNKEWQNLQTIYQNWTGQSLDLDSLNKYLLANSAAKKAVQTNKKRLNVDFNITTNSTVLLDSLKEIDSKTTWVGLLNTVEFSSDIKAIFNSPFPIPSTGSVQGAINASLAIKKGVIQSYDLNAKGIFHRSLTLNFLDTPQNHPFKHFRFLANSSHQKTNLDKFPTLPFTLSVNSINSKPSTTTAKFNAEGLLQLTKKPELKINKGSLSFSNTNLTLPNKKSLKALSANIDFSGGLKNSNIHVSIPKLQLNGSYIDNNRGLTLNSIQVKTNDVALNITKSDNSSFAQLIETLQASAPAFNIKTELTYAPKYKPPILVKNLHIALAKLKLNPELKFSLKKPKVTQSNTKKFTAKYVVKTAGIKQQNLHPLPWVLRGKIQSQLSKALDGIKQIQLQGSISNKAGLVVFHNAFYKPKSLYIDWELPNSYFLAGNPFQKTFKDWPKLLTLGSGQFKAKGNSQVKLSLLNDKTNLLNVLNTKAKVNILGVSGIYNETTLNQVDSQFNLNLKQGVLTINANKLNALQINHGLILGPLTSSFSYQTNVNSLLQGKLTLTKFNTKLFNGQAWLDNQSLDLSQPIHSTMHLSKIDLKKVLKQYPSADIQGSGKINGDLPFNINLKKEPSFTLDKGVIKADSSGGLIQYQTASSLKKVHKSMQLVFNLLEDFHYSVLDSNVTYDANKTLHLNLHLQGKNPSVENGRQVNFNINLEEELPALITAMQLSNQVSETIKKRIQDKLQQ